ncbi:MAG: hypothetical protein K2X99_11500 [Gemmatimonadaceae bacterium]|nr:hypothetical protein [Gemmatimonadaceae bacterium]
MSKASPGTIGFAGDGWGAVAALRSLQARFPAIEVVTRDPDVVALLRTTDIARGAIEAITASVIVCAGYQPIIPAALVEARTMINVHYSLLPRYRGMHSTVWAILNGERELGLSIHLMNQDIDDGPLLAQCVVPYEDQTSTEIMERCNALVEQTLGDVVAEFLAGTRRAQPQDRAQATWVPRRNRDDCALDFSLSVAELHRVFRALVRPYPLPHLTSRGVRYEVADATLVARDYRCTTGRVVNIDAEGVWVKVADGLLVVRTLERDGERIDARTVLKRGERL